MNKEFRDIDFIRLFCACMYLNNQIIFDKDTLRYDLYHLKCNNKYRDLFQDISVKQEIEGNYLDIESALNEASLYGLIILSNNINNCKSMIFIDEDYARVIIDKYDNNYVMLMDNLVKKFLDDKKIKKFVKTLN